MSVRHASRTVFEGLPVSRPSLYICRQCRKNLQPVQRLAQQSRHSSNRKDQNKYEDEEEHIPEATKSMPERLREKLWKGTPPGPKNIDDVYGGPGFFKTLKTERQERQRKRHELQAVDQELATLESEEAYAVARASRQREFDVAEDTSLLDNLGQRGVTAVMPSKEEAGRGGIETWADLEMIGHQGNWEDMPINPKDSYEPWMKVVQTPGWSFDELASMMHQSIVEFHACAQAGIQAPNLPAHGLSDIFDRSTVEVKLAADGTIGGISEVPNVSSEQLDAEAVSSGASDLVESPLLYTPSDTSFLDATLHPRDPSTFQILKRFSQLARYRIPDSLLSNLNHEYDPNPKTIRFLLTTLAEKMQPKPNKVAEQLMVDEKLASRSNLLIASRRETTVDKEKEVGRWKIIEAELRARGIPAFGKAQVDAER